MHSRNRYSLVWTFMWVMGFALSSCAQQQGTSGMTYYPLTHGVEIHLQDSRFTTRVIRVEAVSPTIIHVQASTEDTLDVFPSLMVVSQPSAAFRCQVQARPPLVIFSTDSLQVQIHTDKDQIRFLDAEGQLLLEEKAYTGRQFKPVTVGGKPLYQVSQVFVDTARDAWYGLGENQLGLTNIKGQIIELAQHNTEAFVPFAWNTHHSGLLWDNNGISLFSPEACTGYSELNGLELRNADGQPGALTATYEQDFRRTGDPIVRQENHIAYTYLPDLKHLPPAFTLNPYAQVTWEGTIRSPYTGEHTFLFTVGGYLKVWWNGKLLVDRWRQSWNPASVLMPVHMRAGEAYPIKIQWRPDGSESFFSVKWHRPISEAERQRLRFASEAARNIDYYFVYGANPDSLITGYRYLTGSAPLFPRWAYGFWQSREHYASQQEILDMVARFRQQHVPLDNIVQDWFYWKKDQWGSQQFDPARYPDPRGMIDTLHNRYHVHFMISVWPKFYETASTFRSFWDSGWLYRQNIWDQQKDWVGYVSTFYDAFNGRVRKAFWNLVDERLFKLGVDAWWLDASEPDILSNATIGKRKALMNPTAAGPADEVFNAYPLVNEQAFYEGQRQVAPDQRVFILTRSAWGGSQRYAAATWSGDIGATWADMKNQIATGVSFSMSGIPYWTMDIGGFATESRFQHPDTAAQHEWQELMTRWYQFGAFCPLFRAHGQAPYREIFTIAAPGTDTYNAILFTDRLRYRLLPYIYSLAGEVYLHHSTLMRGLAMDFPDDSTACELTDAYLFGPALLVNPVYTYQARSRNVYLPAHTGWYDLYSGKYFTGGQTIQAGAPYDHIPVFVKAGSILPLGPAVEYTDQKPADTIVLQVYTGADAQFTLYEDDGRSYAYEKGAYSLIPIRYDDQHQRLTIGQREGSFAGMLQKRVFIIRWINQAHTWKFDLYGHEGDQLVEYDGRAIQLQMPRNFHLPQSASS
ncbi:alpha-D-xyloside xylohydrolase [Thermoflavifilum thermophilum]|uniref:Alpha-D-xyloside xylohydrolase n=1 Tax=Thermoflavifilum thermophilum TaxID=1393122 RepID=A0A1I7NBZ1_9BACT|nr:alpha-D-xyloside xylohydrolase [Thermoflavifilum thermophilum]